MSVVLVPLVAVLYSQTQPKKYQSTAKVLLSNQSLSTGVTGIDSNTVVQTPDRIAQTQAEIATTPAVAQRALNALGIRSMTAGELLDQVSAEPEVDADLLDISVQNRSAALAQRLANAYARQFTEYKEALDTATIERSLNNVEAKLADLETKGLGDSPQADALRATQEQLQTLQTLQTRNALVVKPATTAKQVEPKPLRNGLIGLMLGIILGLGLAFLREALDTRVRTAEEVSERLGLTLLARVPTPPRRLAGRDQLVMIENPQGTQSEAFRMLRTNFDFVNLERNARVVMFTSAVEAEGKSTTAANFAIALARAGRHVTLVDLDLRRPYIDRFFGLSGRPGFTQVALGQVSVDDALFPVAISDPASGEATPTNGANGHGNVRGMLDVVVSGPTPPDAGEFIVSRAVGEILDELRMRSDVVVVDAPPLLTVGDAVALTSRVDGVVLVARLKLLRRQMLHEVRRILSTAGATPLGFVVTGSEVDTDYDYGYGYGEPARPAGVREPVA
jgi:Mrp family chromosome partitioning ATPase